MKQILAILMLLFLIGCGTPTDQSEVTAGGTTPATSDWCKAGTDWKWTGESPSGVATATWKIDSLVSSGKYAGLCHVIYTAKTADGELKMDYYFDQSGENGYVEMNVAGQKISQEWHKA